MGHLTRAARVDIVLRAVMTLPSFKAIWSLRSPVFEIQANIAFPIADLFGNFDIVYTTAGSTLTGISGAELQVTDGGTALTLSVKAIDISQDPSNSDVSAANTNVLVVIENHVFGIKGAGLA